MSRYIGKRSVDTWNPGQNRNCTHPQDGPHKDVLAVEVVEDLENFLHLSQRVRRGKNEDDRYTDKTHPNVWGRIVLAFQVLDEFLVTDCGVNECGLRTVLNHIDHAQESWV